MDDSYIVYKTVDMRLRICVAVHQYVSVYVCCVGVYRISSIKYLLLKMAASNKSRV